MPLFEHAYFLNDPFSNHKRELKPICKKADQTILKEKILAERKFGGFRQNLPLKFIFSSIRQIEFPPNFCLFNNDFGQKYPTTAKLNSRQI